ncbi:GntR family transcriptional regulator, partial [Isoptericola sp. QY 916]|nr:winged helix-turn-helix transcriptional regulator [Isoptericola sp. QY 916]
MATTQTNPVLAWDTVLDLGDDDAPLVARVERAVRDAVHAGRVPGGAALPPSRALAETLGVSRWVVTEVYGQLVAEGFCEARVGSGTRIAAGAASH